MQHSTIQIQMDVHGFVTAGGLSSRMGQDKAWLEIDGRPMIQRVIEELLCVTPTVSVIANDSEYGRLGLPVLADLNAGVGPLEAIRVALAGSLAPRVLLVACDLPFVTAEFLRFLVDRAEGAQATAPLNSEGQLEPLCATYSTDLLDQVTLLIGGGDRKVSRLFDRVRARLIPFEDLSHLAGAERFFINVNTPEDYVRVSGTSLGRPPHSGSRREPKQGTGPGTLTGEGPLSRLIPSMILKKSVAFTSLACLY